MQCVDFVWSWFKQINCTLFWVNQGNLCTDIRWYWEILIKYVRCDNGMMVTVFLKGLVCYNTDCKKGM